MELIMRTDLDTIFDSCRARLDAIFDDSLLQRLRWMRKLRCHASFNYGAEQDDFLRGELIGRGILLHNNAAETIARGHWHLASPAPRAEWLCEEEKEAATTELMDAVEQLQSTLSEVIKNHGFDIAEVTESAEENTETSLAVLFPQDTIANLIRLAETPTTPASILEQLTQHPNTRVREATVENPNTPMDALMTLVNDEDADLRYLMAENHNLPLEIINLLVEDSNPYVSSRAQKTIRRIVGGTAVVGNFEQRARASQARVSISRAQ
jgi:hypothetical protein